ncbi:sodium/potassium/calcium exchanger 5-like [Diadema setosum]|uniref:sodium/potassium/calcium exchanger 5-like n=1 Tax=Diadema setosum TaxID=31175 RepID=UPI003B3B4665
MVISEDGSAVSCSCGHSERGRAVKFSRCRRSRRRKSAYLVALCAIAACLVVAPLCAKRLVTYFNGATADGEVALQNRNARSDKDTGDFDGSSVRFVDDVQRATSANKSMWGSVVNCTLKSTDEFPLHLFTTEQLRHGALLIHLLVTAYMFGAIAIICDDYFMPALELTCEVLNLSDDVAGATFMAIGGSSPELFSSLIAVFIIRNDIGIGTIVGSAVFNVLCVIGLCGVLAGQVIVLSCWPLTRDSLAYMVSIIGLVLVVQDGSVDWRDASILLALYVGYCILMYNNSYLESRLRKFFCCIPEKDRDEKSSRKDEERKDRAKVTDRMELRRLIAESDSDNDDKTASPKRTYVNNTPPPGQGRFINSLPNDKVDTAVQVTLIGSRHINKNIDDGGTNNNRREVSDDNDDDDDEQKPSSPFDLPEEGLGRLLRIAAYPIIFAFYVTVPDCKKKRWERCFVLTFIVSLFWIGGLTYVLVWMVSVIGVTLDIPDEVMGLTLLAAGASTPDTLMSISVAREGAGDMAISHSLGSNLFDILIGLGLPWFIQTVFIDRGSTVPIYSGAIPIIAMLLLTNVIIAFFLISVCRFKLGKTLGVVFLVAYAAFVILSILFEMNIIIPGLTLPRC